MPPDVARGQTTASERPASEVLKRVDGARPARGTAGGLRRPVFFAHFAFTPKSKMRGPALAPDVATEPPYRKQYSPSSRSGE